MTETRTYYCMTCKTTRICLQNTKTLGWYCKVCFTTLEQSPRDPLP